VQEELAGTGRVVFLRPCVLVREDFGIYKVGFTANNAYEAAGQVSVAQGGWL